MKNRHSEQTEAAAAAPRSHKRYVPKARQVLYELHKLLTTRWLPGALAWDDAALASCPPDSPDAYYFSIGGGIQHIADGQAAISTLQTVKTTCYALFSRSVMVWEDEPGRTVQDVLWLIRCAIHALDNKDLSQLVMAEEGRSLIKSRRSSEERVLAFRSHCMSIRNSMNLVAA